MSYRGAEAPILFGQFGVIGSDALGATPVPNALLVADNVAFEASELVPSLGSSRFNAAPLAGQPRVLALLDWWPATGPTQRTLAATSDGKIYRDDGTTLFAVSMKAGLTFDVPGWAEGGNELPASVRKAFINPSGNKIQVVVADAVTTRDIGALSPPEWTGTEQPRKLFAHAQRLWGLYKDRAYFSATDDHEDFQTVADGAGSLSIGPGIGDRLESAIAFKQILFFFKWPHGIFMVDTTNAALTTWVPTELTRMTGIAGPNACAVGGNEVVFVAETGHLHLLSNVLANDVLASDVTVANRLEDWTTKHIDTNPIPLHQTTVVYYPPRREFHITLPARGGGMLRMVLDLKRDNAPRIYMDRKDSMQTLMLRRDAVRANRLLGGDQAGTVWWLDEFLRSKANGPYTCTFQTGHEDFAWVSERLRTRRKNLQYLEYIGTIQGELLVKTYLDGVHRETLRFGQALVDPALVGRLNVDLILNQSLLGGILPPAQRRRMRGSCRRLSLEAIYTAQNSEFRCSALVVSFTESGHRPVFAAPNTRVGTVLG